MNERIKELLKQAEERYPKHLAVAVPEVTLRQDALEKFAELIVRECVSIAHPKLNDVGEWAAGMRLVQKRLKEHFGVGE